MWLCTSLFPSLSYFQFLEGEELGLSCDFMLRCHIIMPSVHSHAVEMTNHVFCTSHEDGTSTDSGHHIYNTFKLENIVPKCVK